jgi:hypothetical protein
MPANISLKSRSHSGHLRPHEYTSYAPLGALVLIAGILLSLLTVSSFASASPPPQSSSIALSGIMPGSPPSTAASITYPANLQTIANSPVSVSGSCPSTTLVEIYKNNIFAGAVPCSSNGTYSLKVDLLYGQNTLTAVDYNNLNQAGPTSQPVSITYNVQTPVQSLLQNINFSSTQLIVETDAIYRGVLPNQQFYVPIKIIGGVAPFALNVNWGDNTNQVIPSSSNTTVNASHVYKQPGIYKIVIQASDSQQRVAFLQVAAIVNGQPALGIGATGASNNSSGITNKLLVLWPLYACVATLVVSFWMGEKREKHVLEDALKPVPHLGPTPHPTH